MVGPTAMLIIGMMIADCELKGILTDYHIWLVSFLRLLVYPLIALLFLKFLLFKINIPNEDEILLITFLACITPSASTITQMAQLYGKDTEKASAINVLTSIPVSYTHLDVYKRQEQGRPGALRKETS